MKTNLKKLFLMAIVVFFGMTAPVLAATITVDESKAGTDDPNSFYVTNQGTLTISEIDQGDTFSAYKILDTYYSSATNTVSYEFSDNFKAFLASSAKYQTLTVEQYSKYTGGSLTSGSSHSQNELDALASAYAGYIKTNSISGTSLSLSGSTATLTADAGSYLILPTTTSRVYAVMVGNLGLNAEDGAWVLNNANIVAKVSDASVIKKVGTTSTTEATYAIGDEFSYYLTATVPKYPANATNKKYTITDTMDQGLTFKGINSVTMKDGETSLTVASDGTVTNASGDTVATITVNGQNIVIDFNTDYINSSTVTIEYKSTLNENAELGLAGNKNSALLVYSNDPYGTGTNEMANPAETTVRTYAISILKFETGHKDTLLSGAKFEVYSDSNLTNKVGDITTGTDGVGVLRGVKGGTYYLKETEAPAGYSLRKDSITVAVSDDTDDGDTGIVYSEINNTKVGALPITGGMGTIIFTVSGAVLMLGAIWFIFVYRKKNRNQEI